ncbi:MAG: putative ABC transporter permease [Erysipelotrichaceae bacterium]|nr:putative ABC transporter permease [Erysipelotrichaceae bacterium]
MIWVYVLYFFILSYVGYVYETIAMTLWGGKWENRGFFYGPIIPIYGAGALGGTLLFTYIMPHHTMMQVFFISMFVSAVLEYVVHYVLEKLFNQVWWDYSKSIFNLNGRICLPASIGFGLAGVLIIYFINPFLLSYLASLNRMKVFCVSVALLLIFIEDFNLTIMKLKGKVGKFDHSYQHLNDSMERFTGKIINEDMALSRPVYKVFDMIDHRTRSAE